MQIENGEKLPIYQIIRDANDVRRRAWVRRQQTSGWAWMLFIVLELVVVGWIIIYL